MRRKSSYSGTCYLIKSLSKVHLAVVMGLEFELCSQVCHDSVILGLCCAAWRVQLHSGQPQIIQIIITEEWTPAWTVAKSVKLVEIFFI